MRNSQRLLDLVGCYSPEGVIRLLITITFSLGIAALVGVLVAFGAVKLVAALAGLALAVSIVTALKGRVWALIPLCWALTGGLNVLPIPISIRDLGVLLALVGYLAYRILTRATVTRGSHPLDWIVFVNFAWIAFTFYLHPVGMRTTGSDTFGGRTYWNFFIAGVAYWALIRLPASQEDIRRLPTFLIIGYIIAGLIDIVGYCFPNAVPYIYYVYAGVDTTVYFQIHQEVQRFVGLAPLGIILLMWVCSNWGSARWFNPISFGFWGLLASIACLFAAGFRNGFIWLLPCFFFGSWLRDGIRRAITIAAVGCILVALVVAGQGRLYELPKSAQRALSFLPGKWDKMVTRDAEGSAQWRFRLWREIIQYRLIKDWWLGDGFGVSQRDYELTLGLSNLSEALVVRGSFHSGPLTSIRTTGIIGLILFYILMAAGVVYAIHCLRICRDSKLISTGIFVGIELFWRPIHYTLIFGAFPNQFPETILFIGILRAMMAVAELPVPSKTVE